MKKIYTLVAGLLLAGTFASKAQDTLLYESFNFQSFYDSLIDSPAPPPGVATDSHWYSYDEDGLADGSGSSTARPGGWFASLPFAYADTTGNVAIAANSWFTSPGQALNWLMTPNIGLGVHDTLFWKSAPRQTPRYLDGYKVYLSTTNNDDLSFLSGTTGHLLFTAAEMTALPASASDSTLFSAYTFSSGFEHGQDGTYTELQAGDHTRYVGVLRTFKAPLDAYAGQNVFIGFLHDSFDDNLISLDDVMVRGTPSTAGIKENSMDMGLNVFPNPATDNAQINYTLSSETNVIITVYDITGKVIATEDKGSQAQGRHFTNINTSELAKGFYTVSVRTTLGGSTTKLIVR